MMTRYIKIQWIILALIFIYGCSSSTSESKFDKESGQKEVLTYAGIDSVYQSFETISYDELDSSYINYSKSFLFKNYLKDRKYLIVKENDIYKFLVGRYRVKDFLAHDKYYYFGSDSTIQYLLLEKKLLYSVLDLMNQLNKMSYDKYSFTVRDGFRHPAANAGGAIYSQHIFGRAVDIIVKDVNNDGKVDMKDKQIILDILDTSVIIDKGGIGRYPGSDVIHFDMRGYKARWDEQ
jgi:hypothetical protein